MYAIVSDTAESHSLKLALRGVSPVLIDFGMSHWQMSNGHLLGIPTIGYAFRVIQCYIIKQRTGQILLSIASIMPV
jgi:hypothetical protein